MDQKGYKKLEVFHKAHRLAKDVYQATKDFPRQEGYGLTSQLRRASVSIPTNIVEGQASNSKKEFLSFLNIANRSTVEVEYLLELAAELKYLPEAEYSRLEAIRSETARMLSGLMKAIRLKLS